MKRLIFSGFIWFVLLGCAKQPHADFSYTPLQPKAGEAVQFENHSVNARSYSWNLGDMNISSEKNPVHIYDKAGDYIIDLYATKGLSSDLKTVTITVTQ